METYQQLVKRFREKNSKPKDGWRYVSWLDSSDAQQVAGRILKNPDHLRLETAHPSPLSAARGFFGSRPFSRVNTWLTAQGGSPINWTRPEGP